MAPPAEKTQLTAIILTKNEEANIAYCLRTLEWVDDVVLLDSGSDDMTVVKALEERPNIRIFTRQFDDFGSQRQWALNHTQLPHEWVLFLDADEAVPEACRDAIRRVIQEDLGNSGYYLSSLNHFLGKPIPRSSLYPSWQLRLLKHAEVSFRKEGHGQREHTQGRLGYLKPPYCHFPFSKGIQHWVDRHNLYSTEELDLVARLKQEDLHLAGLLQGPIARRRCLKRIVARTGLRPLLSFLYNYVFRMGFLEGRAGLTFCLLKMAHEIHVQAKVLEREFGRNS